MAMDDKMLVYIMPQNQTLAISTGSEHKDEAGEFLKNIITSNNTEPLYALSFSLAIYRDIVLYLL